MKGQLQPLPACCQDWGPALASFRVLQSQLAGLWLLYFCCAAQPLQDRDDKGRNLPRDSPLPSVEWCKQVRKVSVSSYSKNTWPREGRCPVCAGSGLEEARICSSDSLSYELPFWTPFVRSYHLHRLWHLKYFFPVLWSFSWEPSPPVYYLFFK